MAFQEYTDRHKLKRLVWKVTMMKNFKMNFTKNSKVTILFIGIQGDLVKLTTLFTLRLCKFEFRFCDRKIYTYWAARWSICVVTTAKLIFEAIWFYQWLWYQKFERLNFLEYYSKMRAINFSIDFCECLKWILNNGLVLHFFNSKSLANRVIHL